MDSLGLRRPMLGMASAVAILMSVFAIQLGGAPAAEAGTHGFCENVYLSAGNNGCVSGPFITYQAFAYGDVGSVCVQLEPFYATRRCSGGPSQGVYSGTMEQSYYYPTIENNIARGNYAHGIYLDH